MEQNDKTYKTIGEVARILKLINKKPGKLSTHTLRFWEKNFIEIKPKIFAGNRRYYDLKTIELLKKIQYLLKNKGMTINGVKKLLKYNNSELDDVNNKTINVKNLKKKINKISELTKSLKNNG